MTQASIVGALLLALPALAASWMMLWRRQRPVFFMTAALILVGVGYLVATGAAEDVARKLAPAIAGSPSPAPAAR